MKGLDQDITLNSEEDHTRERRGDGEGGKKESRTNLKF